MLIILSFLFTTSQARPLCLNPSLKAGSSINKHTTKNINLTCQSPINVMFIVPAQKDNPFWTLVIENMKVAAQQFNINLSLALIPHSDYINRFYHYELTKKTIEETPNIDYLITGFFLEKTEHLLELVEANNVKLFSIINDVTEHKLNIVKKPREKYTRWIGHIAPNDYQAGRLLADILMQKATKLGIKNNEVVGITGPRENPAVAMRNQGLAFSIQQSQNFKLKQVSYTDWTLTRVQSQLNRLFERFKNIGIVWAVNDEPTAEQAIIHIKKIGLKPNKHLVIGGMDWSPKGIALYKSGDLTTSLGGHFLDGAISLALIYDYHHGLDFYAQYDGIVKQSLSRIDDKIEHVERLVVYQEWQKLDFTVYSRYLNPSQEKWDLTYDKVLMTLLE